MCQLKILIFHIVLFAFFPSLLQGQTIARADINGDLQVNMLDFFDFREAFYSTEIKYDLNENGKVDFTDFLMLVDQWGKNVSLTEDFNFVFNYGVDAKSQLNTLNDIYTKDMVRGLPSSTKLTLTTAEMDSIYQKMVEIDFFNLPDKLVPQDTISFVVPASSYKFRVINNGKVKTFEWASEIISTDKRIAPLRELIQLMRQFIETKENYKNLPPVRALYL